MAEVVPDFAHLKLVGGWAALYEVNRLDEHAILGPWPTVEGLFLINGFSGRGLQQSPAAGRVLAEMILGCPPFMNLNCSHP